MNIIPNNKSKTQTNKVSNSIAEDSLSLILLNFQSIMNKKGIFLGNARQLFSRHSCGMRNLA